MRWIGLLLIAAAFVVPIPWFVELAGKHDPTALLSQYFGVLALIAMGISQLLATRFSLLEVIFGGLDRIYVLHKWLGIIALALVLLHDTIDAEMDGLGGETLVTEIAETLGEVSLYGLLILGTISVLTFVPYHLWKYTHKLMGGFFAASALHYAFILKPFAVTDPLGVYVLVFCALGIVAYLYTLVPSGSFRGWRAYTISTIEHTGGAVAVSLTPSKRGIKHQAGQFAFIQFMIPGFQEVHPFTISKAPDGERTLRFTIKDLGDFTGNIADTLKVGAPVRVCGPFGHFRLRQKQQNQIWIASGVGVTPFLAWADALGDAAGPVHLFYSARMRSAAPHLEELEGIAAAKPNLHLHFIETAQDGRLTAKRVRDVVGGHQSRIAVSFCGPAEMRRSLERQLKNTGFNMRSLQYEEFEIRSGIGFRRLVDRLFRKASKPS
jgi:predicted ferric reductase